MKTTTPQTTATANTSRIGRKFGMLTIKAYANSATADGKVYKCLCDCGKEKLASWKSLNRGLVKSCGCLYASRKGKPITQDPLGTSLITIRGDQRTLNGWVKTLHLSQGAATKIKRDILAGENPDTAVVAAILRKKVHAAGGTDYTGCLPKARGLLGYR